MGGVNLTNVTITGANGTIDGQMYRFVMDGSNAAKPRGAMWAARCQTLLANPCAATVVHLYDPCAPLTHGDACNYFQMYACWARTLTNPEAYHVSIEKL